MKTAVYTKYVARHAPAAKRTALILGKVAFGLWVTLVAFAVLYSFAA